MASPVKKSAYYNDEIDIRKDVSTLLTKEVSYSTLPYSSILQLPSISRSMKISYDYTNVKTPTSSPSKLFGAASSGNVEQVKHLIAAGVDPRVVDETQSTSLHLACLNSSSPTFRNGSSLYTADRGRHGHLRVVQHLVATGADVNKQDGKGYNQQIHCSLIF